jgi:CRP-like cAMP-binding protein
MVATPLDRLAEIPLFSGCSRKDLERLVRAADEVSVEAGTVLTVEGELGREVFVILTGAARVERAGRPVATLGPGDHVGELSLLDGGPRTATVTTTEPTTVLVLTRQAFNGVLDEIPTLAHRLLVSLAHRLRSAEAADHSH